jgi:hypothetical protein
LEQIFALIVNTTINDNLQNATKDSQTYQNLHKVLVR